MSTLTITRLAERVRNLRLPACGPSAGRASAGRRGHRNPIGSLFAVRAGSEAADRFFNPTARPKNLREESSVTQRRQGHGETQRRKRVVQIDTKLCSTGGADVVPRSGSVEAELAPAGGARSQQHPVQRRPGSIQRSRPPLPQSRLFTPAEGHPNNPEPGTACRLPATECKPFPRACRLGVAEAHPGAHPTTATGPERQPSRPGHFPYKGPHAPLSGC